MQRGMILRTDAEFEYVIQQERMVEISLFGDLDYVGKISGYTTEVVIVRKIDEYCLYVRDVSEIRVA